MKLSVSKGKYVLDKDQLKDLFCYIYEKGFQNGVLVESGVGLDRTQEELGLFMLNQSDTKVKRSRKQTLPMADFTKPLRERMADFANKISNFSHEYSSEELKKFYYYWAEHNEGEEKMRFEKLDTFNIELRLKRFKFGSKKAYNNGETKSSSTESALRKFVTD